MYLNSSYNRESQDARAPFKSHHDSKTNGEVEYDVVDGVEKLWEDVGVDLRVDIIRPHEDPCQAVVQYGNCSEQNVTNNNQIYNLLQNRIQLIFKLKDV